MNQKDCSEILLIDLKKVKPRSFTQSELELIQQRLDWAFAIGFESGRSHKTRQKGIVQLDGKGKYIRSFDSIRDAAKRLKTHHQAISRVCRGERHSHKGFQFMYRKDYDELKNKKQ